MLSKASQQRLSATLHLSVVPRSAVSHGKERHLVAAIQFASVEARCCVSHTGLHVTAFDCFSQTS